MYKEGQMVKGLMAHGQQFYHRSTNKETAVIWTRCESL